MSSAPPAPSQRALADIAPTVTRPERASTHFGLRAGPARFLPNVARRGIASSNPASSRSRSHTVTAGRLTTAAAPPNALPRISGQRLDQSQRVRHHRVPLPGWGVPRRAGAVPPRRSSAGSPWGACVGFVAAVTGLRRLGVGGRAWRSSPGRSGGTGRRPVWLWWRRWAAACPPPGRGSCAPTTPRILPTPPG